MATVTRCDICNQETDRIVGKIFYAPMTNGNGGARSFHNNYQLHGDVGACCEGKLRKAFNWRKRVSQAVYRSRGKRA